MQHASKYIKEIAIALRQLHDEMPALKSKEMIYFPDFNLLYPYIYQQTEGRYALTDTFGTCLFALNNSLRKPPNIHLVFSTATVFEFLFSLERHHQFFTKQMGNPKLSAKVFQSLEKVEAGELNLGDIPHNEVREALLNLDTIRTLDHRLSLLLSALENEKIDLMNDHYNMRVVNSFVSNNKGLLIRIQDKIASDRAYGDDRNTLNKILSYKADAFNVFLPAINETDSTKSLNFVCSNRFYHWAPEEKLRNHQRSPLFLIMLLGNLHIQEGGMSYADKLANFEKFVDSELDIGLKLLELSYSPGLSGNQEMEARSYIYKHIRHYIDMAKELATSPQSRAGKDFNEIASHDDYLEMMGAARHTAARTAFTIRGLVDDRDDEIYRDFVDDERLRDAFPSLKFR